MADQFARTELLLGKNSMNILSNSRVIVFGVGGVGGYVTEVLARSGVGSIDIVDKDDVDITNVNRQIIATLKTVGRSKVDVMSERIRDINPDCKVTAHKTFFLPENSHEFNFRDYDYVVDAIDTVTAKIELITACTEAGTPIISSMGAGNKLDPTKFQVADIYKTSVDPLARVMRRELKKRGVKHLKVVYSTELPLRPVKEATNIAAADASDGDTLRTNNVETSDLLVTDTDNKRRKDTPGSIAFVPSVAGMIIGGEVIKDLVKYNYNFI